MLYINLRELTWPPTPDWVPGEQHSQAAQCWRDHPSWSQVPLPYWPHRHRIFNPIHFSSEKNLMILSWARMWRDFLIYFPFAAVGGARPPPFIFTVYSCSLCSSWEGRYTPSNSSPFLCALWSSTWVIFSCDLQTSQQPRFLFCQKELPANECSGKKFYVLCFL